VAERLGEWSPDGVPRVLNGGAWEAEPVRDALRTY
jgi:hypothetical protein